MTNLPTAIARLQAKYFDDSQSVRTADGQRMLVDIRGAGHLRSIGKTEAEIDAYMRDLGEFVALAINNREKIESLLDSRPITAEGLVELGFTGDEGWWQRDAGTSQVVAAQTYLGFFWCVEAKSPTLFSRDNVFPQPQTMGDVHTLLLRLARGME